MAEVAVAASDSGLPATCGPDSGHALAMAGTGELRDAAARISRHGARPFVVC
jgi:hypothetical protein